MLTINEIFYSIQGESTYAGHPCVFVRLTACDLRCTWCIQLTPFTGGKRTVDEVIAAVECHDCPLVEIRAGTAQQEDV
jgi:7-carboxy-7-deazaguanine synthase